MRPYAQVRGDERQPFASAPAFRPSRVLVTTSSVINANTCSGARGIGPNHRRSVRRTLKRSSQAPSHCAISALLLLEGAGPAQVTTIRIPERAAE